MTCRRSGDGIFKYFHMLISKFVFDFFFTFSGHCSNMYHDYKINNVHGLTINTSVITGSISRALLIMIIIIIIYKIHIAPYTICKKIALRRLLCLLRCEDILSSDSCNKGIIG